MIPEEFIGRLLRKDEVTELERILIAASRMKPASSASRLRTRASSVRV